MKTISPLNCTHYVVQSNFANQFSLRKQGFYESFYLRVYYLAIFLSFMFITLTPMKVNAQLVPSVNADISLPVLASKINHISCDGYVGQMPFTMLDETFQLFAWDGTGQGWACNYQNGAGASTFMQYSFTITTANTHPEIAIVSTFSRLNIYAIVVYNDPFVKGAVYEVYPFNRTTNTFNALPLVSGTLTSVLSPDRVLSVAGDEFGHFAMICDDGSNVGGVLHQKTGYYDFTTSSLIFGLTGIIDNPGFTLTQPDIDITYFSPVLPTDAMVHLACLGSKPGGTDVFSFATRDFLLATGGTYNISGDITGQINPCGVADHPSIAVNDGFQCFMGGMYNQHAGVTYADDCSGFDNIMLYSVSFMPGSASTPFILNSWAGSILGQENKRPTIATKPYLDDYSTVVWNFNDNGVTGLYALEGVANTAYFNHSINDFAPFSADMQINNTFVSGFSKLNTVSGLGQTSQLFFYYDNSGFTSTPLYYKVGSYTSLALRKADAIKSTTISISPNPVVNSFNISSTTELTSAKILDLAGRVIMVANGDKQEIESVINSNLLVLAKGCYILSTTTVDLESKSTRFVKE